MLRENAPNTLLIEKTGEADKWLKGVFVQQQHEQLAVCRKSLMDDVHNLLRKETSPTHFFFAIFVGPLKIPAKHL